eukprot:1183185-Prorocentrum_minimum.AAC.2
MLNIVIIRAHARARTHDESRRIGPKRNEVRTRCKSKFDRAVRVKCQPRSRLVSFRVDSSRFVSLGRRSFLTEWRPTTGAVGGELHCTGLYWTGLDWTGLYRTLLDCTGLYWTVLDCTGLYSPSGARVAPSVTSSTARA